MPHIAPYGSWKSPITSDLIVAEVIGLGQIAIDGNDVYWIEMRPAESGRNVIVRRTPDGHTTDMTAPPFNARTRVHEYGGGAFAVADGFIYFSNFEDQRLYRQDPGQSPRPITPVLDARYADAIIDRLRGHIICVREDHTLVGREPSNTLVRLSIDGAEQTQILAAGNDFYSSPRLSPDGSRLAWLTWSHPNMPWDGTELWVAPVEADGTLRPAAQVAGSTRESIYQPEWSPDGSLYFISDRSGWWNLYRWRQHRVEPMTQMEVEFGKPQWLFGTSSYGFVTDQRIVCSYRRQGTWQLASLDTVSKQLEPIPNPYSDMDLGDVKVTAGRVVFAAGSPSTPLSIVQLDLASHGMEVLRHSSQLEIDTGYLSTPRTLRFPTEHGLTAHAFYYPPRNRDYAPPPSTVPPLLVKCHGGPTGAADTSLNLQIHYWTSRGIAVLDVNYGGSVGYGRSYRQRLLGQWGIVDVDDCINGARFLVQRGEVDGSRLAINGRSAGGFTALAALTFRDFFKAGASYYGISDLETLARDTHKFESRYLNSLIGPYPERRELYLQRSPIHYTHLLSCPLILFQGLEDKIVPPSQAELMYEAVRQKGLPIAYLEFAGEQHGFRWAANIKRALDAELYFYAKVFGFELAEPIEPVRIENLPG